MRKIRKIRPFSLIELIIAVTIISLIVGLAVPNFIEMLDGVKRRTAKADITTLEGCVDSYYLDMSRYPESLDDLVRDPGNVAKWRGPYIKKGILPQDPWGFDFVYEVPGADGRSYDISSYGPDHSPGGEGADADVVSWLNE